MRTTKADFEMFQSCAGQWCDKLGVKDWSLFYSHDDCDGAYARTYYKLTEAIATIVFCKDWDDMRPKTTQEIDRLAMHEVLHLVLAPLVAEAGDRYTTQSAVDVAEHRIIRQLEHLVEAS